MEKTFHVYEIVTIKKYKNDQYNNKGIIQHIYEDGRIWVSNLNQPFQGTISEIFYPEDLEQK